MFSIEVPVEVTAALDALDAAVAAVGELDLDRLDAQVRLHLLEQMETSRRRQVALSHDVIGALAHEESSEIGGPAYQVIADWLRISYAEARRRIRDVAQLSPRLTLTGQELPPELPATAQTWREGMLDAQHLRVIQTFVHGLPRDTPTAVVEHAEAALAEYATQIRPDQLQKVANRAAVLINPDGKFSDADRARQRGFAWSAQRSDGMSEGKLIATPELRAQIDAWLARFAAPGMCNPDDDIACDEGTPNRDTASIDQRTPAQRNHDALAALVRGQLGDPKLGQHNGLPVTVIVSTTLQELTAGAGVGITGGGTVLPMSDLIRMASHAYQYLAIFDKHTSRPLYLGRTRRIASPDQRLVLYAKDRGCTHPGCDAPGYWSEVHHVTEWAAGGPTDADNLTFACKGHHKLLEMGWRTRKLPNGQTQWIPPPRLGCPRAPTTSITPNGLSGTTGKAPGSTITMRRSDAGPTLTNVSPMTEQHRNLVLMRHAKSAYPDDVADHGRPLSSRGVRESGLAGDWLRANLPAVDAVLCSTATRARETLAGTGVDAPVRYVERLYGAAPGTVIEEINGVSDDVNTLLVVGHEPTTSAVAIILAGDDGTDFHALQRISTKFATSGIAVLRVAGRWDQVGPGGAALVDFHVPR
jgi:phosphohistidine phosphatase SixA